MYVDTDSIVHRDLLEFILLNIFWNLDNVQK